MSTTITAPDTAVVRAIIENWASAVSRRDLAGILRDHDPHLLLFDVPPPLHATGLEAYKRSWDAFFSWATDPVVFDVGNIRVTAGNDVAFVTATVRCTGQTDGRDAEEHVRLTIGLQKISGRWTIVHEHHSVAATS
jgi:uncharacterized protein (TIGR02246 family)